MNTLLPTTTNTTSTTKNLNRIAAVIFLTAVFVFANSGVFAQSSSNSNGITTAKEAQSSKSSYINYKGIEDKNEAKKAWLKDHPEENVQPATQVVSKPAVVEADKKVEANKAVTKQVVTPVSAETIDNAVEVKAPAKTENKTAHKAQVKNNKVYAQKKEVAKDAAPLIYENYNGIKDLELAKEAWVKDHSDVKSNKVSQDQNEKTRTRPEGETLKSDNKVLPNADRRLPANYDDSKTNNEKKD